MGKENWKTVGHNYDKAVVANVKSDVDWSIEKNIRPYVNTKSVRVSYRCSKVLVSKK